MFTDLKPFLKDIDVKLVVKSKKDSDEYVLVVMPVPRRKSNDANLNNSKPFFLVGDLETISKEWASEKTRQRISNFRSAVVNAGAFDKMVAKAEEPKSADKAEKPAKTAPKKKAPAKPKDSPELVSLKNAMKLCGDEVKDNNQPKAKEWWKDIAAKAGELAKTGELDDAIKAELKALQGLVKAMPEQQDMFNN